MTTSAIKIGEVTIFFSATLGSGSSFRHPLDKHTLFAVLRHSLVMCLQPHSPHFSQHDHEKDRSYRVLDKARQKAFRKDGYDSATTRRRLTELFRKRFDGAEPRSWQLEVTEAILLGVNSLVIAGTGTGKTMPFMMPLMLDPKKALIISTLKIRQADQVCWLSTITSFLQASRFEKAKVSAIAVNGESWNTQILQVCARNPC